jgi:hypothetical protein
LYHEKPHRYCIIGDLSFYVHTLEGVGKISFIGFWAYWKQKSFARYIAYALLILGLSGLYFAKQAGTSGGEIRHTEIRSVNALPQNGGDDDHD